MIKAAKFYDFELLIWIVNKVFEIYVEIVFVEICIMFLTWPWGGQIWSENYQKFQKTSFWRDPWFKTFSDDHGFCIFYETF